MKLLFSAVLSVLLLFPATLPTHGSTLQNVLLNPDEPYFSQHEIVRVLQGKVNGLLRAMAMFENEAKRVKTKTYNTILSIEDPEFRSEVARDLRGYLLILEYKLKVMRKTINNEIAVLEDLKESVMTYPAESLRISTIPGLERFYNE